MTERYDQDNILGYVEGELSDDERAAFEAVLADDHELRQLVSQMKLDRQALRGLGTSHAPVGLIEQVIQTHERAALLGDPAAPEPLPMTVPVSRWTFRRALAYGSIAAVLILSFGLVFQTLIPPGFLNQSAQYARNTNDTNAADPPVPDVGPGIALLDEDSVYDTVGARSPGRSLAKESSSQAAPASSVDKLEEGVAEAQVQVKSPGRIVQADEMPAERKEFGFFADGSVDAQAGSGPTAPVAGEEAAAGAFADASTAPRETLTAEPEPTIVPESQADGLLARAGVSDEADGNRFKKQVLADAFAGYEVDPQDAPTRLVVNSPSPTQARRDIRNWALANSVRFVEEPANESALVSGAGGRALGYGERFEGVPGLADARQADRDSDQLGESLRGTRGRSLQKQTQIKASATLENTPTDPAATSYYVLIDSDQVPSLLIYLNRTQGQRAELIAPSPDAPAHDAELAAVTDEATAEMFESRQDAEAESVVDAAKDLGIQEADAEEKDDAPKATANRLVDTESGWYQGRPGARGATGGRDTPIVRGLAVSPSNSATRRQEAQKASAQQDQPNEKSDDEADADITDDRSIENKEKEEAPPRPNRQPTYFDWSRLLEPRQPATTPSAADLADAVSEQSAPDNKLRLQVIIQQTADEVQEADSKQDEQDGNSDAE